MTKGFRKGIIISSIYYGIGLALILLTVLIWNNRYAHAPGPPFIMAAFVLIGGTCLLLINLLLFKRAFNKDREKGSLLIHTLVLGSSCIFIAVLIKKINSEDSLSRVDSEYLIIGQEPGTLTIMKESGDTIFFQKEGSVIIDKDSIVKK
jgi:hypothetical protein